jgi:hypothetical protein
MYNPRKEVQEETEKSTCRQAIMKSTGNYSNTSYAGGLKRLPLQEARAYKMISISHWLTLSNMKTLLRLPAEASKDTVTNAISK